MSESKEEKLSREEQIKILIGFIAAHIRHNDWDEADERINKIKELCEEIDRFDLIVHIDDYFDTYDLDGRWFRDEWEGPYDSSYEYDDLKVIIVADLLDKCPESLFN